MAEVIKCARCRQKLPGLEKPPFSNPLGKRIHEQVCQGCWKAWLMTQNQLINHYGLSTINPEHQQFLIENLESFLFGQGLKRRLTPRSKARSHIDPAPRTAAAPARESLPEGCERLC